MTRPSARFQLLFLQYRKADSDAAVNALTKWTEGEVIAEAVPAPNDDVWARAALAALLTETGMRKGKFGYYSDYSPQWILDKSWGLDNIYEVYSYRSYSLVSDLTRIAKRKNDARLLAFCSRWYVHAASYSLRYRRPSLIGLKAIADHDLGEQAEIRLLLGAISESAMGPFQETATRACGHMIDGPDGCVPNPETFSGGGTSQEALYLLRHAIEADPTLAEAHLRLGHTLHIMNQTREGRPHLEEALRLATDQHVAYVAYMAAIYLGDVEEHDNHFPEAIAYFRDAVATDPGAHIANIALGEALLRSGDSRGWTEARRMFDDEDQDHPKALDPWFFYRFAQYWHVAAGLREMREVARAHQ